MIPEPVCQEHYLDNQGLCHRCGVLLDEDMWLTYLVGDARPVCDDQRHLVCRPYSLDALHRLAVHLGIKRCWFHKDHYDIPKRRIAEITARCEVVAPRAILHILKNAGMR